MKKVPASFTSKEKESEQSIGKTKNLFFDDKQDRELDLFLESNFLKSSISEGKKRKYENEKSKIPFWWRESYKSLLKVEKKILPNQKQDNGKVSWSKKFISKSNWNSPINFDTSSLKAKEKKNVIHKTGLSKKKYGEDEILRSRKILLQPTPEQKEIIQEWMRITRFVYNITCRYVKEENIKNPNFKMLKSILLNKEKNPNAFKYSWLFEKKKKKEGKECKICPRDAKDMAIQEFVNSFHSSTEMLKEKQKKSTKKIKLTPNMKERSQNDHQRVIIPMNGGKPSIRWDYDKKKEKGGFLFWTSYIGKIKVKQKRELKRLTELIPEQSSDNSAILKYESPGRYYMIISYKTKIKKRENNNKIVALDPGVRTFQTGFDNNGDFKEFGNGDVSKLFKQTLACDKLQSQIDESKRIDGHSKEGNKKLKKKRKKLKKKYKEHQNRITGLKESFHKNLAHELCKDYDHILISKFNVSGMIKKHERKIKSDTVRKMLNWGHYSFRKRLINHSEKAGSRVHEVSEHYTSKCCGNCGILNEELGGKETFYCKECKFNIPRDYNGSRNIFLMNVETMIGYATCTQVQVCIGPNSKETLINLDSNVQIDQF